MGTNDVLEAFPVSPRIAFDLAKGRLWALCPRCRNWNLAPIDERWEAVEEAERLFEGAAVLSSTENIALGRLSSGTELIRVGRAKDRELAGWRYGERFLKRWRRHRYLMYASGGVAALWSTSIGIPGWLLVPGALAYAAVSWNRPVARAPGGAVIRHRPSRNALLLPESTDGGWILAFPRRSVGRPWQKSDPLLITGDDGLRVLRAILPKMNSEGGDIEQVWYAVGELNRFGSADRVLRGAAVSLQHLAGHETKGYRAAYSKPHQIFTGRPEIRLALEMAANEETERRALEGELALLEREWKDAEELAAIADDLLVPPRLRDKLSALKSTRARSSPTD